MAGRERRISPRKPCAVPLRFRVVGNGYGPGGRASPYEILRGSAHSATAEGRALNLSERGVYFSSREKLAVGQALEMYFTLPHELTGRGPEPVRCSARIVHVDEAADERGLRGAGAAVESFEKVTGRDWSN